MLTKPRYLEFFVGIVGFVAFVLSEVGSSMRFTGTDRRLASSAETG